MTAPAAVAPGVFFAAAEPLPRGRHALSRDHVLAAQRERLLVAATELLADQGYPATTVGAVATRAGTSRAVFYRCFATKDECLFAAYDRFIEVILTEIVGASSGGGTWDERVSGIVGGYLGALQRDRVVARAFQVEMDAMGPPARERRRAALTGLGEVIRAERQRFGAEPALPLEAYVGVVYAVRQLASDALDTDPGADLLTLVPTTAAWVAEVLRPLGAS